MKKRNRVQLLIITGFFLVSIVGFYFINFFSDNGALKEQILDHLEAIAFSKAERVGGFLDEKKNDLEFLSTDSEIIELFNNNDVSSSSGDKLKTFQEINNYLDLVLINMDGKVIWSADKEKIGSILTKNDKTKLGEIYNKVQNDFGVGIFDPGYYSEDEQLSIYVTTPVLVESETIIGKKDMIGIIALQIDNFEIEKRIVSDFGMPNAKIYLINKNKVPITSLQDSNGKQITELEIQLSSDCFKDYRNYYFSRRGEQVDEVIKSGVYESYSGNNVFASHQYMLQTGWCVFVELEYKGGMI